MKFFLIYICCAYLIAPLLARPLVKSLEGSTNLDLKSLFIALVACAPITVPIIILGALYYYIGIPVISLFKTFYKVIAGMFKTR